MRNLVFGTLASVTALSLAALPARAGFIAIGQCVYLNYSAPTGIEGTTVSGGTVTSCDLNGYDEVPLGNGRPVPNALNELGQLSGNYQSAPDGTRVDFFVDQDGNVQGLTIDQPAQ